MFCLVRYPCATTMRMTTASMSRWDVFRRLRKTSLHIAFCATSIQKQSKRITDNTYNRVIVKSAVEIKKQQHFFVYKNAFDGMTE